MSRDGACAVWTTNASGRTIGRYPWARNSTLWDTWKEYYYLQRDSSTTVSIQGHQQTSYFCGIATCITLSYYIEWQTKHDTHTHTHILNTKYYYSHIIEINVLNIHTYILCNLQADILPYSIRSQRILCHTLALIGGPPNKARSLLAIPPGIRKPRFSLL